MAESETTPGAGAKKKAKALGVWIGIGAGGGARLVDGVGQPSRLLSLVRMLRLGSRSVSAARSPAPISSAASSSSSAATCA